MNSLLKAKNLKMLMLFNARGLVTTHYGDTNAVKSHKQFKTIEIRVANDSICLLCTSDGIDQVRWAFNKKPAVKTAGYILSLVAMQGIEPRTLRI